MAAGGVDVLRRRYFRFSRKEFDCGKDGSRVVDASSVRPYGGRHQDNSRRNGFYGKTTEERETKGFSESLEAWTNDVEASKIEDVVQLPPEKKRKVSPVIWDREGKGEKISFKKRVLPITPLSYSPQSLPKSVRHDVLGAHVSKGQASESDSGVELSTVVEPTSADEFVEPSQPRNEEDLSLLIHGKENQVKEEEIIESHNILTSRWASEGDSPQHVSGDEWTPGRVSLSPESGEFQREVSTSDRERMSSSDDEDGFYVGSGSGGRSSDKELSEDFIDSDDKHSRHVGTNGVYYGSEDDGEVLQIEQPTVSTSPRANMLQSCRSVFEYEKLNKINEGTYGVVYKARDKKTGEIVALKKVKMDVNKDSDGFPLSSLREINILSSFSHPSIVNVKEVVMDDDDGVFMVMEYMEYDLKGLMEMMKEPFSIGEVKSLMLQLLEGVKYFHDNWVLHRDLKTSNILLNKEGELKICDFGLSRQYGSPLKPYTPLVVTLWYR